MTTIERIFNITQEIADLEHAAEALIDDNGEITDTDEFALIESKIKNLISNPNSYARAGSAILWLDSQYKQLLEHEKRVGIAKQKMQRRRDFWKNLLEQTMPEGQKIQTPECKISWRKTQDLQIMEESLDDVWKKPKYRDNPGVPDKDKIKKALKDGMVIDGVVAVDRLSISVTPG
jgi:hypothetical protein